LRRTTTTTGRTTERRSGGSDARRSTIDGRSKPAGEGPTEGASSSMRGREGEGIHGLSSPPPPTAPFSHRAPPPHACRWCVVRRRQERLDERRPPCWLLTGDPPHPLRDAQSVSSRPSAWREGREGKGGEARRGQGRAPAQSRPWLGSGSGPSAGRWSVRPSPGRQQGASRRASQRIRVPAGVRPSVRPRAGQPERGACTSSPPARLGWALPPSLPPSFGDSLARSHPLSSRSVVAGNGMPACLPADEGPARRRLAAAGSLGHRSGGGGVYSFFFPGPPRATASTRQATDLVRAGASANRERGR